MVLGKKKKAICKSAARKRADVLAAARGRCTETVCIAKTWRSSRPPAAVGSNPFGGAHPIETGGAVEGQGVLAPETNIFDEQPAEAQLPPKLPLTALAFETMNPALFGERGSMKTLQRWPQAAAARSFPAYQVAAQQQLLAFPKRELLKLGTVGVQRKLRPLCAAINCLLKGCYNHGLLSKAQLCSSATGDVLRVLKVAGSTGFIHQHVEDVQAMARDAGLSDNTLGAHFTYAALDGMPEAARRACRTQYVR